MVMITIWTNKRTNAADRQPENIMSSTTLSDVKGIVEDYNKTTKNSDDMQTLEYAAYQFENDNGS